MDIWPKYIDERNIDEKPIASEIGNHHKPRGVKTEGEIIKQT